MFLVLSRHDDRTALAVAARLRSRHGASSVMMRTLEEVALAPSICHELGRNGSARTRIRFHDGTECGPSSLHVVFNRLNFVGSSLYAGWREPDRDYARMEIHACLLSWLSQPGSIVVNRPTPAHLSGPFLRPLVWMARAVEAGFRPYPMAATTGTRHYPRWPGSQDMPGLLEPNCLEETGQAGLDRPAAFAPAMARTARMTVIGDRIVGPDLGLHQACARLAAAVGATFLSVDLAIPEGGRQWCFVGASILPDLSQPDCLEAAVDCLETCAGSAAP